MEEIKCFVENIIFRNERNGYTIFSASYDERRLTACGNLGAVQSGECLLLRGAWINHPSYGREFKVESYEEIEPDDALSIKRYLASGSVKGIGPRLAERIVKKFGDDTFRIMETEPERLAEVKGISENMAMAIAEQVQIKKDIRQAEIYLQDFGLGQSRIAEIISFYGPEDVYFIMQHNPYQLAEDIDGIGFDTADRIAIRAGIQADSEYRIRSGIIFCLSRAEGEGHTYLPESELIERTAAMLDLSGEKIGDMIPGMEEEHRLVIKRNVSESFGDAAGIYLPEMYEAETESARMLINLSKPKKIPQGKIDELIPKLEKDAHITLEHMQREAVEAAIKHGLIVITGGPGTGKTTIINILLRYFSSEGLRVALAAPTGRAAKRMEEATGRPAKTIHRLLEVSGEPGNMVFGRDEGNPLSFDVVIIDEMSMVDIELMHALLKAISPGARLIMSGDVDQLPSVGPGRVLGDIIDSGAVPVSRLNENFRQSYESDIVRNAHRVNNGEYVPLDNKSRDFFFLKRSDPDVIRKICVSLIRDKLPKYTECDVFDVQLLSPRKDGALGVRMLNELLQRQLNPPAPGKRERERGGVVFREGDKIMQIKNNYDQAWDIPNEYGMSEESGTGIFNGDLGIIESIDEFTATMKVRFDDGRVARIPFRQLDEIDLAYAITIHKSQGSEYPAVVIPLLPGPRVLMNRCLLYTAITRARRCVVIVGDEQTFRDMVANTEVHKRYTGLKDMIQRIMV